MGEGEQSRAEMSRVEQSRCEGRREEVKVLKERSREKRLGRVKIRRRRKLWRGQ